jgi:hypothetical protein
VRIILHVFLFSETSKGCHYQTRDDESNMETERKDVGKVAQGHEQDKEEGPVSIETVSENGDDESSFGKEVPTSLSVDDKTIREPRPALERVSVQDQRRESPHVPTDTANVSRDEKETGSHRPVPLPMVQMSHPEEGTRKLSRSAEGRQNYFRALREAFFAVHESAPVSDPVKLREAIAERDPIKMSEALFGSLPVDWQKADVSNTRATTSDDKADPVSERFGLFGKPESSGDKEKLGPEDEEEEKKPAYPNVERYNAKYGFHKRDDDDETKPVPGEETAATKVFFENKAREMADALLNFDSVLGSKGDQTKDETPCTRCGKIHPSSLSGRFFTLRRETPAKKEDEKKEEQGTKTATAAADTAKKYEDSLAARVASVQKYLDLVGETVVPGTITNQIKEMRFQEERTRRINVVTKDLRSAATCKGPSRTFEILELLVDAKRYVKRDEDEPEFFPQWIYYALKKLVSIAHDLVMTKNKYNCSQFARSIDEVYSDHSEDDKTMIKILNFAKGAVSVIAGEVALAFLEK